MKCRSVYVVIMSWVQNKATLCRKQGLATMRFIKHAKASCALDTGPTSSPGIDQYFHSPAPIPHNAFLGCFLSVLNFCWMPRPSSGRYQHSCCTEKLRDAFACPQSRNARMIQGSHWGACASPMRPYYVWSTAVNVNLPSQVTQSRRF